MWKEENQILSRCRKKTTARRKSNDRSVSGLPFLDDVPSDGGFIEALLAFAHLLPFVVRDEEMGEADREQDESDMDGGFVGEDEERKRWERCRKGSHHERGKGRSPRHKQPKVECLAPPACGCILGIKLSCKQRARVFHGSQAIWQSLVHKKPPREKRNPPSRRIKKTA